MKSMIGIRGRYVAVALLSGVIGGAILTGPLNATGLVYRLSSPEVGAKVSDVAHVMPCGQGASPITLAVKLSNAQAASALAASGLRIGASRAIAPGTSTMTLISPRKADGTPVSLAAVQSILGVQSAGAVFPQSADPTLRSCDYKLQDKPRAQRLVSAAETALASAGVASRQQMDGDGAMYLVSDNPLDTEQVIVTIDVPGTGVALPGGQGMAFNEVSHEAFVDCSTGQVTQIVDGPSN